MDLNYKASIKIGGAILCILGAVMVFPFIVSLIYHEYMCSKAFGTVGLFSLVLGGVLFAFITPSHPKLKLRDGAFIVTMSWLTCCIIGAIPFVLSGALPNWADALFESSSGFSTTGASIVSDIEGLPKSILFWRTFSHWLGGMGILLFTIALLPMLGMDSHHLAAAETPGPTLSKLTPKISDTARYLYIFYFALTILLIFLLLFGGMNLFDAICHSFSAMGTGGFANYNDSMAHYNSLYIEIVLIVFMLVSATNFNLFFVAYKNGIKTFFQDGEWKLYVLIFTMTTTFIALYLWGNGNYDLFSSFRHAAFQDAAILTTTGFSTENYGLWPTFCQMTLFLLFFCGSMSSSTSGGVKVVRILVLLKLIKRSIAIRLHPNAIIQVKLNNHLLSRDTVSNIANFLFAYIGIGMIGTLFFAIDGHDFITCISASFSFVGNVGPGFGNMDPAHNFSIFSDFNKVIASILMIAGRLEIFTLLMLFTKRFWKSF